MYFHNFDFRTRNYARIYCNDAVFHVFDKVLSKGNISMFKIEKREQNKYVANFCVFT